MPEAPASYSLTGSLAPRTPDAAGRMAVEAMAGTASVLRKGGFETAAFRRRVTSPGGTTARGLAALERGGVRSAFSDAVDAAAGP